MVQMLPCCRLAILAQCWLLERELMPQLPALEQWREMQDRTYILSCLVGNFDKIREQD